MRTFKRATHSWRNGIANRIEGIVEQDITPEEIASIFFIVENAENMLLSQDNSQSIMRANLE